MLAIFCFYNISIATLTKNLAKGKVDCTKILFIDGISKSAGQKVSDENCICVESAGALTRISIVVNKAIKTGKFDGLLFDSLSTLLIYNKKEVVVRFVQSLVNTLKKHKMTGVFTLLKGDADKGLLKEVGLFVDAVK